MPTTYKSNRAKVEEQLDAAIKQVVIDRANEYERNIQEMFRAPKTGTLYGKAKAHRRFRKQKAKAEQFDWVGAKPDLKGLHQASAPGEAPAIDSRALARGVKHIIRQLAPRTWSVIVGITVESGRSQIAKWLEFGTRKIAARPSWRPALEMLRSRMRK